MKTMKKKRTIVALLLAAALALSACSGASNPANTDSDKGGESSAAPTAEHYTLYSSEWPELNYLVSSNSTVNSTYTLLIDGFVQYDKYGQVQPNAATNWDVSDDGLVWTFHLRDDMKWYDCNGNVVGDVVADDFVAAAEYVLDPSHKSRSTDGYTDYILNANEYYNGEITDFSQVGVKALDDKTVEYTLISPVGYFLSVVSNMSFLPVNRALLEQTGDRFATSKETMYTSGAYLLTEYEPENLHVFTYNPDYWNAEMIKIAKITETYNKEASSIGAELFRRGEITAVTLPDTVLDEYMNDPEKSQYLCPTAEKVSTVMMLLNFAVPNLDAEYEPENWNAAVNNLAFRKAIYHAIDRVANAATFNSFIAEDIVSNTVTVPNYITYNGKDYLTMGKLAELTAAQPFDKELALQYKEQAMEELAGKVTFPVKLVFSYNTGSSSSANQVQVFKQQIEGLLGTDFIVVEPVGFASTGFNTEVRDAGKFCMIVSSTGPDYRDPSSLLGMFTGKSASRYGSVNLATEYMTENGLTVYDNMYNAAFEERLDTEARLNLFAEAEAYLIDQVLAIPYYQNPYSFGLTYIQPFTMNLMEKGTTTLKGAVMLDEQLTREQYDAYKAEYDAAKSALGE